jgi:hypothetical protein
MAPDYDLSNLPTSQADLWIYLNADIILAQIHADQGKRQASPLALGDCTPRCSPHCEAAGCTQQCITASEPSGVCLGYKEVN